MLIGGCDILPFLDGNGELWLGNVRSACYAYDAGKRHTQVMLYEFLPSGECTILGYCNQMEKAPDICHTWIEYGRISVIFQCSAAGCK